MELLIKNGRVLDPFSNLDQTLDLLITENKIASIAPEIELKKGKIIDAANKIVVPGLIDIHVHAREPGQRYKETIRTVSRAAASGGFTTIVCAPNTFPPIDSPKRVKNLLRLAQRRSFVNFYTYACITKGMKGKEVVNVKGVVKEGASGLTDDGFPVRDMKVMRKAAKAVREFNIPICLHCEETPPLPNKPLEAKYIRAYLQFVLSKIPFHCHFFHITLAESVDLIAEAKRKGLSCSAEVAPHHFTLSERDIKRVEGKIDPNFLVNPPLRSPDDVQAIKEGLKNNIIDVIASDHAPHTKREKNSAKPPYGIIGLETTLGIVLTHLVEPGVLSLKEAIRKMTYTPAKILGIKGGRLAIGFPADITIIDPEGEWTVDPREFKSKGRNCPFAGWRLKGRAVMTIVRGKIVMSRMRGIRGRL